MVDGLIVSRTLKIISTEGIMLEYLGSRQTAPLTYE